MLPDMRTVYIAGPFGDPDRKVREWNIERARLLARLAMARGLAPIMIHGEVQAGTYGDDADPAGRRRGLEAACAIAARTDVFWMLQRDDGTESTGCTMEFDRWFRAMDHRPVKRIPGVGTWSEWRADFAEHAPHLLEDFDRLSTRPR